MRHHLNYREQSIVRNILMHMNPALRVFSAVVLAVVGEHGQV